MASQTTKSKWLKGIGIALVVYFVIGGLLEITGYGKDGVSNSGTGAFHRSDVPPTNSGGWMWNPAKGVWRIIITG